MRACALLTVGAAIIGLSADWRDRVIAPGPLARQHAQLLERAGTEPNCAACHTAAKMNAMGWMASLVTTGGQPSQSQLCMKCHSKSISANFALAAHNLPPNALRQITTTQKGSELFLQNDNGQPFQASENSSAPVSCAVCHREHHGLQANMSAIDNAACQTCHQRRYASFAADHPDFGLWPYQRRTRIAFNHAAHQAKHFAEKKLSFDCRTCHVEDATGKVQQLASYETTCAKCHDEKIATSIGRGVPIFALPTLDIAALKRAGHDIGPWPKSATGDFDGRLPPAMKLLLSADPDARNAILALGTTFDFQDVNPRDPIQLAACAKLASAIKSLLADVAQRGPDAMRERLSQALMPQVVEPEVAALMAGLSPDTMRGAATWWPGLEVGDKAWPADAKPANLAAGSFVPSHTGLAAPKSRETVIVQHTEKGTTSNLTTQYAFAGTWFRDDATLSIRYRPAAHADPVLAAWLGVLAETPDLDQRPIAAAMFKELSKTNAPGLCASCHSVERSPADELVMNWRAYDRAAEPRGFTKFAHRPHLLLPQLADCTHCHAIDVAANAAAAYADLDPRRFVSDFMPLSKRQCTQCHTAKAAGDQCQSCHNYHVEWMGQLRIADFGLRIGENASQSDIRNPKSEIH